MTVTAHECHGNHNHRDKWQQTDNGGRWRSSVGRSDFDDNLHRDGDWSWRQRLGERNDHRNDWRWRGRHVWRANRHGQRQSHIDRKGKFIGCDGDCNERDTGDTRRKQQQQAYVGRNRRDSVGRSDLDDDLHRDGNWSWRNSYGSCDDHRGIGIGIGRGGSIQLTVASAGTGAGTVTSSPAGNQLPGKLHCQLLQRSSRRIDGDCRQTAPPLQDGPAHAPVLKRAI